MSLFTEYLASLSSSSANAEAAQKAAKAQAEAELKAARFALLVQRDAAEEVILQSSGLDHDYQELLETEAELSANALKAKAEVQAFADAQWEAEYAASLLETKAQAIESLVTKMEAEGLLPDQIVETKQRHLDAALRAHNAAKASKERIAKLLANKKIK